MPHDKRGTELAVGDTVMVPCRVKAIHLTEDFCNVDLETTLTMPPQNTVLTLTLNSRQTIKPIATHTFYEYGKAALSSPSVADPRIPALRHAITMACGVGGVTPEQQQASWREVARIAWDLAGEASVADSPTLSIRCPACGVLVQQVASATLSLALWQHWNWACKQRASESPASPAASPTTKTTI